MCIYIYVYVYIDICIYIYMYIYISISIYKCCGWKKSCTQLIGGLSHYIYGLQPSKVMQDLFPSTVYIYIHIHIHVQY